MKFIWVAESSTEMRKSKESSVEKSCDLEGHQKLNKGNCLEASFMTNFPKLKMLIIDCELAKPNCVYHIYEYKQSPEHNRKSKKDIATDLKES